MCGGDTAASTPHCSLNIHSLRGWFTRASTRGTANSCLESNDVTRLSSSSPVAATTTSAEATFAFLSTHGSQPSPSNSSTPGAHPSALRTVAGSCSISVTSWPRCPRSAARWRPTAPAPVITTRMSVLRGRREQLVEDVEPVLLEDQLHDVSLLKGARRNRDEARPHPVDARDEHLSVLVQLAHRLPDQVVGNRHAHPEQVAAHERFLDLLPGVHEHQHDLLHTPGGRRDRRDVQALVDLRALRVVDARDHVRHVVVLERDASGDDVGVVSVGDRDESIGLLDARLLQDVAVVADLAPELTDVDPEVVTLVERVSGTPDAPEYPLVREELARVRHEGLQERPFRRCQAEGFAVQPRLGALEVDLQVAEAEHRRGLRLRMRSAERRPHPREELLHRERLVHVVVRARVERPDLVG